MVHLLHNAAFPYTDIGDAIFVAESMLKGGGMGLSRDQLAAAGAVAVITDAYRASGANSRKTSAAPPYYPTPLRISIASGMREDGRGGAESRSTGTKAAMTLRGALPSRLPTIG